MTIEQLEQKIIDASQHYYEGSQIISDKEFDDLIEYLRAVNPTSKVLTETGWGYDPYKNIGEKENHMYGKVIGIERKPRKIEDIPNDFINSDVCLSAKLDGLSMICYFVNGKFVRALTRGNGDTGINKTDKVELILKRELKLPNEFDFTGAIRGEVCISNDNWNKMKDLGIAGSNQRNTATGIINRDETTDDIQFLDLIFYKVVGFSKDLSHIYNEIYQDNIINENKFDIKFLKKFIDDKFIVDYIEDNGSLINQNDLEDIFNKFNINYPCDGIVITRNKRKAIEDVSDKYQKKSSVINDEIAYKFITETAVTTIENIAWKMSKGNKAIPVINVKPVELSGATVQNATAFNAKYVYENDLDVGATVELVRSGEVIPYITNVIQGVSGTKEKLNSMCCPFCGNKLEWQGVDLVCTNVDCANRDEQNLKIWIANIAPIEGISEKLIFKFLDELNISSLDELYSKTYAELKYKDAPDNSHKGKFNKVLSKLFIEPINWYNALIALNINSLGDKTAKKLINSELPILINTFLENMDMQMFINEVNVKLNNIVGPAFITTLSTLDSLNKLKNLNYIKDRLYKDDNIKEDKELVPVVITGKLSVPRKKFEEYLNENGYEVKGSITKDIKYLITDGESNSVKYKRAKELNIEIISEMNIRKLIDKSDNGMSKEFIL